MGAGECHSNIFVPRKRFGYWVEGKIKKYKWFMNHYLGGVQTDEKWGKKNVLREAEQKHPSRSFTKEERLCKFSELSA